MTCAESVAVNSGETKGAGCLGPKAKRVVRPQRSPLEEEPCPGPCRAVRGVSLELGLGTKDVFPP